MQRKNLEVYKYCLILRKKSQRNNEANRTKN